MNAAKLARALKQELQRSPAKAVLLAGGLVVALYFWLPLLAGWLPGHDDSRTTPTAVEAAALPPATAWAAAAPSAAAGPAELTWTELRDQLARDPRRRPAQLDRVPRDPFQWVGQPPADADDTPDQAGHRDEQLPADPAELGLVLNGTVVGPRQRRAQINGTTFAENELLAVAGHGTLLLDGHARQRPAADPDRGPQAEQSTDPPPVVYRLKRVLAHEVVLEHQGREYPLRLAPATLADGDRIVPSTGE